MFPVTACMPSMTAFARFPCARTYRDDEVDIVLSENESPGAIKHLHHSSDFRRFSPINLLDAGFII